MSDHPIIQTEHLTKRYQGQAVLDGVSMQVNARSICGFLGPNGAGKTTAIRLLLGLTRPTSGKATVFGMDSVTDSLAIRRRVGYLSQQPSYYGYMTARQTLHFTLSLFGGDHQRDAERRVAEVLDLVGLTNRADRPIKGFSGGERQRLGIAQAQINRPDLLILDEPAAALDPIGRRDVLDIMTRLRETTTIFYSTHILEDVQRVSDSVIILDKGRLIVQAPIQQLMNSAQVVYNVVVHGNIAGAEASLRQQRWVEALSYTRKKDEATFMIIVTDQVAAEQQLISTIMAAGNVTVSAFGRKQEHLEDVFITLMQGSK